MDFARQFLAEAAATERRPATRDELSDRLNTWLKAQVRHASHCVSVKALAPLSFASKAGCLQVRWMPRDQGGYWLVVRRDWSQPQIKELMTLGLTRREAEVLAWILEGKTNPEIGVILGCRGNTVRKHVEHILGKLGVENRGAPASRVFELLAHL